ncbi:MAG: hypothetical protein JSW02_02035 [candidate division WOR-3 bacterium]|nr:MAG: hypothetical protein JSW02_02035 [candidate division WOR-3 bacterium]
MKNDFFSSQYAQVSLSHHFIKKVACLLLLVLVAHAASLADSLYEHGLYELARIEYTREFFFYPSNRENQNKRLRYALSVCQVNPYNGIQELHSLKNDFDTLTPDVIASMAKQYIILEDYSQAWELLIQTEEKPLIGYTLMLDNRLNSAKAMFLAMGKNDIAQEITTFQHMPRKSPGTAGVLSAVCPGTGEIYAGNVYQGIKGFILTAGSGYLIYNAIKGKKYIDAVLIFNFLFQRFYMGSIHNARRSATDANLKSREKWLERMKHTYFSDLELSP